jgi:hypothetical protein
VKGSFTSSAVSNGFSAEGKGLLEGKAVPSCGNSRYKGPGVGTCPPQRSAWLSEVREARVGEVGRGPDNLGPSALCPQPCCWTS